jgi:hypothetical protein
MGESSFTLPAKDVILFSCAQVSPGRISCFIHCGWFRSSLLLHALPARSYGFLRSLLSFAFISRLKVYSAVALSYRQSRGRSKGGLRAGGAVRLSGWCVW